MRHCTIQHKGIQPKKTYRVACNVDPNTCSVNESLLGYKASLATSTDQAVLASIPVSSFNDAEASGLITSPSFESVVDMSFDSASPLLDIADPQQLLDLKSCSGLSEEEEEVKKTLQCSAPLMPCFYRP
ncbi:hypothetical protein DPMN_073350 [Dreissena polymorpha]|uniref:Uncharacterized protein n=1 Tax=Dreissena polymorpha TaxID=45954 RepID=A0A9D4BYY6_DREPO|nr:hypothetical protein DPMN_073350 [Dreissena polymorpha]